MPYDRSAAVNKEFRERLSHWQAFYGFATKKQMYAAVPTALSELDGLWAKKGLMKRSCLVSGYGFRVETVPGSEILDADQDNIIGAFPKFDRYTVARYGIVRNMLLRSEGLSIVSFEDDERLSLAYQFLRPEIHGDSNVYVDYQIDHRLQIKVGTLSLVPVNDLVTGLTPLRDRYEPAARNN